MKKLWNTLNCTYNIIPDRRPLFMRFITSFTAILLCSLTAFSQANIATLLADLKATKNVDDRITLYGDVFHYYQYEKPDSAQYYAQAGLKEFTETNEKQGIAAMTVLLALLDGTQGRLEMARAKHTKALALYKELGNKRGIATVQNGLGSILGRSGKYKEAADHIIDALKNYEELHDTDGIAATYMKLGVINEKSNLLDKALESYSKTLQLIEIKGSIKGTDPIFIYNNVGIVYAKMGNLDKALSYFERALQGSDSPEKTGVRLMTLNNLGIVFDKTGNDKKALYYFDEALKIARDRNLPEDFARTNISRSSVIGKTNPDAAIKVLQETLKLVDSLHLGALEADLYDEMVTIFKASGKYKEAFQALSKLTKLEDSLESKEKAKEIMNLQSVHELEQSNAKLSIVEARSENQKLVKNIIIGVAIVLAIMFIILLSFYRKTLRLNEQLVKRENELQKSNEMKDKLFSVIGHDLRGPIGNIPVMLELLDDTTLTAEERQYLVQSLIVHTKASTETLDKLLYWGQAQIKGLGIKPTVFTVGDALQSNITLINITAQQKQINIINNIPGDTTIFADPSHFDFLIRNLLSNAVKFTHNGGSVSLDANAKQKPGYILFSVKDSGIGISSERQKIIFKPFASSTRGTADEKGTSIGLMLCKEFVNENGGDIWVESEEGKGATFFFTLKASA